ncbi:MAG TPA: DUF4304 domain-containing protein [Anaerolineales bacterium]|nr:DUF4304 domain-containing protein [Anaerolineales bacterium]
MPFLSRVGFEGDGERFQRTIGDVIHVIGLQKNKYGGSCCVNLGIHLSFLPLSAGNFPQPGVPVRAESCEFQWRLKPAGYTDYWWAYEPGVAGHLPLSILQEENRDLAERARHLATTYETTGEPAFQHLISLNQIAALIKLEDLDNEWPIVPEYAFTPGRAALTMARIHKHLGDYELARQFALAGLQRIGKAKALLEELEKLSRME